jgi:hypothetical protein
MSKSSFSGVDSDGTLTARTFSHINDAIAEAISLAADKQEVVKFKLSNVTVAVAADSDIDLLLRDWRRGVDSYLGSDPVVGPYPKKKLSAAEKANDAKIEAAKAVLRQTRRARQALLQGKPLDLD